MQTQSNEIMPFSIGAVSGITLCKVQDKL